MIQAQDYIRSLPIKPRIQFSTLYPAANPMALDLLGMFSFSFSCYPSPTRISIPIPSSPPSQIVKGGTNEILTRCSLFNRKIVMLRSCEED